MSDRTYTKKDGAEWKVHTSSLLQQIGNDNKSLSAALRLPLMILGQILHEVGQEAVRINDPKLNHLMCRLTIYTVADPGSPDYNPKLLKEIREQAYAVENGK